MPIERLALGTAQFGLAYGVANRAGKVCEAEVARILAAARMAGIDTLDTAEAYGNAELVLGAVGVRDFCVVGKVGHVDGDIRDRVVASLRRLGVDRFEGLLLHAPDQLLVEPSIGDQLESLKAEGLAAAVGFSVYDPEQTACLLERFTPDLVQLPLCPLDRRWDDSGMLGRLARDNVRVHLRSAYLQGLLLMPPEDAPGWAAPWVELLTGWHAWLAKQGISPARGALALALARPVERVVIGVENTEQLAEALHLATVPPLPESLRSADPHLLDPRSWATA